MHLLVNGSEKKTTKREMYAKFYQEIQFFKEDLKWNWNKF
jgi:hypothetical protein